VSGERTLVVVVVVKDPLDYPTNFARGPPLMLYEFISLTLLQGRGVSEG